MTALPMAAMNTAKSICGCTYCGGSRNGECCKTKILLRAQQLRQHDALTQTEALGGLRGIIGGLALIALVAWWLL